MNKDWVEEKSAKRPDNKSEVKQAKYSGYGRQGKKLTREKSGNPFTKEFESSNRIDMNIFIDLVTQKLLVPECLNLGGKNIGPIGVDWEVNSKKM